MTPSGGPGGGGRRHPVSYTLGFVSTAVNKSAVRSVLRSGIGGGVVDVDQTLCGLPSTETAIGRLGLEYGDSDVRLIDVMTRLPRISVLELWREALDRAMTELVSPSLSESRFHVLLAGNMYHSPRRSEYYSAFDVEELTAHVDRHRARVARVVMFIDDIYDMHARLSGDNEIFSPTRSLHTERNRLLSLDKVELEKLPVPDQALFATEVQTAQLVQLLHWRQLEVTFAERVARSLGVPYLLWAVKQDVRALEPWLIGNGRGVTYVSHPISRPRREHARTGQWPAIVEECNALQLSFAKRGFSAVMPTAIDEFRIQRSPSVPEGAARMRRLPSLTARWKLIDEATTLYQPPVEDAPDFGALLAPKRLVFGAAGVDAIEPVPVDALIVEKLDGALRALEGQIEMQVSARDHTIVVNTDHTVVFRPFFEEIELSGGVRAEIEHWQDLAVHDPRRRIAFLHRVADARPILGAVDTRAVEEIAVREVMSARNLTRKRAEEAVAQARHVLPKYNMLDRYFESPAAERGTTEEVKRIVAAAPIRLIWSMLAQYGVHLRPEAVPIDRVGLWVVDDQKPWDEVLEEVCNFLSGADGVPREAFELALEMLPA